jgi:branched-chain amino acid transport system ATP-binding protein
MSTLVTLDNVSLAFGLDVLLDKVKLTISDGERVCLIGRNGAGKTTTLRSLMGLLPKRQGSASIDGTSFLDMPAHTIWTNNGSQGSWHKAG